MKDILGKYENLLGRKRSIDKISNEDLKSESEGKKSKESKNKDFELEKPELSGSLNDENIIINLDEKDKCDTKINNFCQICRNNKNILIFYSFKSILNYFSENNHFLFPQKNEMSEKYEDLVFDKLKMICTDCLLKISKNKKDFENLIKTKNKNEDIDCLLFNNLFQNSNLKNFNNNGNQKNFLMKLNEGKQEILEKINDSKNHLLQKSRLNLEKLNVFDKPFLPKPFDQNYANANFQSPNFFNPNYDFNNLFTNPGINYNNNYTINQLNNSGTLVNSLFKQPFGITSKDIIDISNLNDISPFNNNGIAEKNDITNIILNGKKEQGNISNENNQKNDKNSNNKNKENDIYDTNNENEMLLKNKDFDEIFELISQLYKKLLIIKYGNKLNLDLNVNNINDYYNNFSLNPINSSDKKNEETNNCKINLNINQIHSINNNTSNEFDLKH